MAVGVKTKNVDGSLSLSLEEIEEALIQNACTLSAENLSTLREILHRSHRVKFGGEATQRPLGAREVKNLFLELSR
jgi:hypothetical protein